MQLRRIGLVLVSVLVMSACGGESPRHSPPSGTSSPTAPQTTPTTPPVTSDPYPDGVSDQHLIVGGVDRTYRIFRPAGLTGSVPLVVMLHGAHHDGAQAEQMTGFDATATRGHFIAAYPDGKPDTWNAGGICCGVAAATHSDDVRFITELVTTIRHRAPVDAKRIYAAGSSNGAILAYRLACETSLFAAIGPVAGTELVDCAHPRPTSVIHIHGEEDPIVVYGGGLRDGDTHVASPPITDVVAQWRAIDHCQAAVTRKAGRSQISSANCADGRQVILRTVTGFGHGWPGGSADVLWDFFSRHSL